uniref:Envelope membrane protein n=1 Tax=Actinostachys pennula TaxID=148577 RepID=A0A1S5RUN2_9MONI|nr:envelope membrane protein [Actinostachys pennula]
MKRNYWRLIQWFRETPHRSSDRAHKASKQIQFAKKYLYYARVASAAGRLSEAALTDDGFDLLSIVIYWSLLEHRTSVFIPSLKRKLVLFHRSPMSSIINSYRTTASTNVSPNTKNSTEKRKFDPSTFLPHYSNALFLKLSSRRYLRGRDSGATHVRNRIDDLAAADDSGKHVFRRSEKYEQMNRKLVRIEAVLNDSVGREKCAAVPPLQSVNKDSNDIMVHKLTNNNLLVSACAYELTNLIPRSINRTLSQFGTELMSQSTPLVLHNFQLAKHQASSSLKTIGCLIIFFFRSTLFRRTSSRNPGLDNYGTHLNYNSFSTHSKRKKLQASFVEQKDYCGQMNQREALSVFNFKIVIQRYAGRIFSSRRCIIILILKLFRVQYPTPQVLLLQSYYLQSIEEDLQLQIPGFKNYFIVRVTQRKHFLSFQQLTYVLDFIRLKAGRSSQVAYQTMQDLFVADTSFPASFPRSQLSRIQLLNIGFFVTRIVHRPQLQQLITRRMSDYPLIIIISTNH